MELITGSPELQQHAEELLALSTEHGFPFHGASALVYRGRLSIAFGQAREGLALLAQGLAAARATGTVPHTPTRLMWLAEAYAMLGQLAEGLKCLAEAAAIIETSEERYAQAELHRVHGDLLNSAGDQTGGRAALSSGRRHRRAPERKALPTASIHQPRPVMVRPG